MCDAPPDETEQLCLLHVIYENDGIDTVNVWVPTIDQLCQKIELYRAIFENFFFQKTISSVTISSNGLNSIKKNGRKAGTFSAKKRAENGPN